MQQSETSHDPQGLGQLGDSSLPGLDLPNDEWLHEDTRDAVRHSIGRRATLAASEAPQHRVEQEKYSNKSSAVGGAGGGADSGDEGGGVRRVGLLGLAETCSMAESVGSERYPQLARLHFLQVVAREHYARPLVVLYGCRLPPIRQTTQAEIVSYVKDTLDVLVEKEYDAIYFNYGTSLSSMASFSVLRKAYNEFDRKYKKNIKTLYVVHPSRTLLTLYSLFKAVISKKFERKLRLVKTLDQLQSVVNLELMRIPMSIKSYDINRNQWSEFGKQFSQVSLNQNQVPYLFEEAVSFLRTHNHVVNTVGLFRVSGSGKNQKELAKKYSMSPESFEFEANTNAHDVTGLLKQFLNQLPTPILSHGILNLADYGEDTISDYIVNTLDESSKATLYVLFSLFHEIVSHSQHNSMTEDNLMRCTSLSLAWSETPSMSDLSRMEAVFRLLLHNYSTVLSPPNYPNHT